MIIDYFVRVIKNVKNSLDAINLSNKSHKREFNLRLVLNLPSYVKKWLTWISPVTLTICQNLFWFLHIVTGWLCNFISLLVDYAFSGCFVN